MGYIVLEGQERARYWIAKHWEHGVYYAIQTLMSWTIHALQVRMGVQFMQTFINIFSRYIVAGSSATSNGVLL